MTYPRHPATDSDVIIFGFIIILLRLAVIMLGVAFPSGSLWEGLRPLPFW